MRIVADTNVLVSGMLWHGNPARIIDASRQGMVQLLSSAALLDELRSTISRPMFLARLQLLPMSVDDFMSAIGELVEVVVPAAMSEPVSRDPDDDLVLATAVAGSADLIVTGDLDLLVIQNFRGISILSPSDAVIRMRCT